MEVAVFRGILKAKAYFVAIVPLTSWRVLSGAAPYLFVIGCTAVLLRAVSTRCSLHLQLMFRRYVVEFSGALEQLLKHLIPKDYSLPVFLDSPEHTIL